MRFKLDLRESTAKAMGIAGLSRERIRFRRTVLGWSKNEAACRNPKLDEAAFLEYKRQKKLT